MKSFIINLLPENDRSRKWLAITITIIIAGLVTIWGIYGMGQYGIALFILTPFFMGYCPTILYGLKKGVNAKFARSIGLQSLGIFLLGLFIFALEGLICIVMTAPLAVLLTLLGSVAAHALLDKTDVTSTTSLFVLFFLIPSVAWIEKDREPELTSIVTSIEIAASPEEVWKMVIEFPELDEPEEFIFKTGIAYPIHAKLDGKGVGAIRYCNFSTGSFVEPITEWNEPLLLKFDVEEQPDAMKELSFWDINAPHLHDYFVSRKGQFKLTPLPNGHTKLEGTTWYSLHLKPAFYWRLWSNYIVHKIHERVLVHIKNQVEKGQNEVPD